MSNLDIASLLRLLSPTCTSLCKVIQLNAMAALFGFGQKIHRTTMLEFRHLENDCCSFSLPESAKDLAAATAASNLEGWRLRCDLSLLPECAALSGAPNIVSRFSLSCSALADSVSSHATRA